MMEAADAYRSLSVLVTRTVGPWDDAIVQAYVDEFVELEHADVLADIVARLARAWTEPYRPPIGAIIEQYRSEVHRLAADLAAANALPPAREDVCSLERGAQIAREAYLAERRRLGDANPNTRIFDEWMTAIGLSTPERRELRIRQREQRRRAGA
jgi:hypothetical protein